MIWFFSGGAAWIDRSRCGHGDGRERASPAVVGACLTWNIIKREYDHIRFHAFFSLSLSVWVRLSVYLSLSVCLSFHIHKHTLSFSLSLSLLSSFYSVCAFPWFPISYSASRWRRTVSWRRSGNDRQSWSRGSTTCSAQHWSCKTRCG